MKMQCSYMIYYGSGAPKILNMDVEQMESVRCPHMVRGKRNFKKFKKSLTKVEVKRQTEEHAYAS